MEGIIIRIGFENMDFVRITDMLAATHWSPGIKIGEVTKGARNSALMVGAFHRDTQIGYARAISDKTRFAYILDVYVDVPYRKQGIGRLLVRTILESEELQDVYQWFLITKDAQGVYAKLGFKELTRMKDWMEIRNPRPVR